MAEFSSDLLLAQLSKLIAAQMGLHFPKERWHELERRIAAAARVFDFPDSTSCTQWLLSAPLSREQIQVLASHLTVGETYFFREQATFDTLRDHILPDLIRARRKSGRHLRIWSAGCCTGEEPYSLAILLNQLIPDWKEWSLTILATDINPQFLHKAAKGIYGEWSFRRFPLSLKKRYFAKTATGHYEIVPQLREQVTFAFFNLVKNVPRSAASKIAGETCYDSGGDIIEWPTCHGQYDVILCRNVLMYFTPERARKVIQKFYDSLMDGGWLIPGSSEISSALFSEFQPVYFPNAIFYQKQRTPSPGMKEWQDTLAVSSGYANRCQPVSRTANRSRPTQSASSEPIAASGAGAATEGQASVAKLAENSMPLYHTSVTLYEQGRHAEAEEQMHLFLEEHPMEGQALRLMARIYANQGKLDEALAWCRRAIATDQLSLGSHYLYATIQTERGEIEEAVQSLKRVLYLDPDFVMAHFALGCLARGAGKQQEAGKHFTNVLVLLRRYPPDTIVPESDEQTAARLLEIVETVHESYAPAARTLSHTEKSA